MLKRLLAIAIVSLLIHTVTSTQPTLASPKADKQAKLAEKVRAGIAKLGTGTNALVEVKLRDKSQVSGYISEANDNRFLITDAKTGASVPVAYTDVTKVKGHNLSTGAKIGIGIVIGFALVVAIVFLTRV